MRLPVSTKAVAMMVRLPPSSKFLAAPKNLFGRCRAFESTPPDNTFPLGGTIALYARARRVMLSSKTTTSRLCSTNLLAFSITISATCTCRWAGSSKVELMTSPRTERSISVTSSGLSSIKSTIRATSGKLVLMLFAIDCNNMVFPVRGGATIKPRCPLPIGVIKSMTRAL